MAVIRGSQSSRLLLAIVGSLGLNVLLWSVMAAGASRIAPIPPPRLMEVSRVVIDPATRKVRPAVVKAPPKPVVKVKEHVVIPPKPAPHQPPKPPPPVVRQKVITAPTPKAGPSPDNKGFTAPPDGNAPVGKPLSGQGQGDIKPDPPKVDPPKADPPKVDPPKVDPPKVEPPKVEPPKVEPPKVDPPKVAPKPKGPTKDSEPVKQVQPEIPDSLKSEDLKAFVRVRVDINEDGSFEVVLRTSSGKPEVDRLIIDALKKWKWKPALRDGEPVKSTQAFKFEIEVR